MTELNKKILELVEKNASVNEISELTGLTNKQLFYRLSLLKNQGFNLERKYYYNGDIAYKLVKGISENNTNNETTILTSKKDTEFKALLLSDLHLGNINDRVDLIDKSYEYCVKEGINIIINAGDFIDGTLMGSGTKKIGEIDKQIEYLLKVYPFDKNILNFICLGNHDYSALTTTGQDLSKILSDKRHDIVSIGYSNGILNIKNEKIYVRHPINDLSSSTLNNSLILRGHSHETKYINGQNTVIYLPSLSNCIIRGQKSDFPSAIKMTLEFHNGFFKLGLFEHLLYTDNIYKISESQFNLFDRKNITADLNKNLEERKPIKSDEKEKKLTLQKSSKSNQIDKFKARYGIE